MSEDSSSEAIGFLKSNTGAGGRRRAFKVHRLSNLAPYLSRCFDQVRVGKVRIARRGPVPLMPENLADQGQVLAGHHGLADRGVPQVVQAKAAEFGVGADRAPAVPERIVALAARMAREYERIGITWSGQRVDQSCVDS